MPEGSSAGPLPAVTVVVPSYRSRVTLAGCLASLAAQDYAGNVTVIVAHSGDEPVDPTVRQRHPDVRWFVDGERRLPGLGRNLGIAQATTPLVAFIDSDCVAGPSWLSSLVAALQQNGWDGAGGGIVADDPASPAGWAMHLLEFGEWLPSGNDREVRDFPSCNALYRRDALARGFPTDLFPSEDTVANAWIRAAGGRLGFAPSAVVTHQHRRSLRGVLRHSVASGRAYREATRREPLRGRRLLDLTIVGAGALAVAVRFGRATAQGLTWRQARLVDTLRALPVLAAGAVAWAAGFVGGKELTAPVPSGQRRLAVRR